MAIWQFDTYLVPSYMQLDANSLNHDTTQIIDNISDIYINNIGIQVCDEYFKVIGNINREVYGLIYYGDDRYNCVNVDFDDEIVRSIKCRFDKNTISKIFVDQVVLFCRDKDFKIFGLPNIFIQPTYKSIFSVVYPWLHCERDSR